MLNMDIKKKIDEDLGIMELCINEERFYSILNNLIKDKNNYIFRNYIIEKLNNLNNEEFESNEEYLIWDDFYYKNFLEMFDYFYNNHTYI